MPEPRPGPEFYFCPKTARGDLRYSLLVPAILACLFGLASPSEARDCVPYGGARVGYLEVDRVDSGSLNVGLLGGAYLLPRFALEGSVDYHSPDFDLFSRSTYAFQASLYFYPFTAKRAFRPYGVGGMGFYLSSFDYDATFSGATEDESRSDGGFHAGFGFDAALPRSQGADPRVYFTVDVRYLFTRDNPEQKGAAPDGLLATIGIKAGF